MKNDVIDVRGLSCPQPVIKTLARIKELQTGAISILVDSFTAQENVCRAVTAEGWQVVDIHAEAEDYQVSIRKDA